MQVIQVSKMLITNTVPKQIQITYDDEIQNEHYYWRTVKILYKMFDLDIITQDAFRKIFILNKQTFTPLYASLVSRRCNR